MTPLWWGWAALVWGYALGWFLVTDPLKLLAYRYLDATKTAAPKRRDESARRAPAKPDVQRASPAHASRRRIDRRTQPRPCAAERIAMKIEAKDFRVREGDKVNLEKWPTKVDPVYKSKEQYKSLLEEHVAKLGALQQLHYASNRHACC